jgi:hypothetical protein
MILPLPAALKSPQDGLKFGQNGPKIAPRRPKDLPKTSLNNFFPHLLFCLRFGSVWGPTWAPFDPLLGAQDGPKIVSKNVRKSGCRKMASKITPRRPKIAPRRPRTPQRPPQEAPRSPQERPSSPQERRKHREMTKEKSNTNTSKQSSAAQPATKDQQTSHTHQKSMKQNISFWNPFG